MSAGYEWCEKCGDRHYGGEAHHAPSATPSAWSGDVALRGPNAPKNDGTLKHLIEYLLTVYERFGNTLVTERIDLQWGATALHKRDEQKKRIEELEQALAARSERLEPSDPAEASTYGILDAAKNLLEAHCDTKTAEMIERSKRFIPNVPIYRPIPAPRSSSAEPMCSVCAGTGTPASGKPCICGGAGTLTAEAQGLREALHAARSATATMELIVAEVAAARTKHPTWPANDTLFAAAIVAEESGELMRAAVQHKGEGGSLEACDKEAIQTAATAIRFLERR